MKLSRTDRVYQHIIRILIALISLIALYPLLYVVVLSLTSEAEWTAKGGIVLWSDRPTIIGYVNVIQKTPIFMNALGISALRVLVGTPIILFFTYVMGYVLSRKGLPGRNGLLIFVLITILFSGGMIPTYLVVKDFHLLDRFWVYVIPGLVDSWGVLVFKQFFENIPQSVIESAEIDGANEIVIMFWIVLPMSTAVLAAMALFNAVGQWNSWFDALIYIRSENLMPIQLIIYTLFQTNTQQVFNGISQSEFDRSSIISMRMVLTVVGTLPILVIYPFLQKYFVKGVYVGSVKG